MAFKFWCGNECSSNSLHRYSLVPSWFSYEVDSLLGDYTDAQGSATGTATVSDT
jgi:hypothetical protein